LGVINRSLRRRNVNDATLVWTKSLVGTPTQYSVIWTYNGVAQPADIYPVTAALDASGYSSDFAVATGITPNPGDILGATVQAVDTVNNLTSAVVVSVPPTVTIPTTPVPPGPPQGVTLALS
jgi:hypothetical protein